jgi:hypothetical protein
MPRLTRVHSQGPAQRGAVTVLIIRWEAVSLGRPFPALDADVTLVPDGEHAVLIGLTGVYRAAPGTPPGQPAVQAAAAAATRAILTRIADAVSDPGLGGTRNDETGLSQRRQEPAPDPSTEP